MRQAGSPTKGKSAHQQINSATAKRTEMLKNADKAELEFVSKVADYTQQKINSENTDWIVNGVFK